MTTTLRAVVMSAGSWSRSSHLPALLADGRVELIGVSSLTPGRAQAIADEFGVSNWHMDWRDLLQYRPDIVVVSSPPIAHEEQALAALAQRAHVLVEKPFALDGQAAERMRHAAARADRHLLVGFGWPQAPAFALGRELVAAGELGEIEHVMSHLAVNIRGLLSGGNDGGWGGADGSSPETYTRASISGGGAAAVSMSHQLGLISWMTGLEFTSVSATTSPSKVEIELHVSANLTFSSGAGAAVSCASTHPDVAKPQWLVALYGSLGQLWISSIEGRARLVRSSGEVIEYAADRASGEYDPMAPTRALIESALGGAVPAGMSAGLGAHVVHVTDAIYESARTGRTITVQELS